MTDRSLPPPASDRRAIYVKLGVIALVLAVVVGIGVSLFGDAVGSPDEGRRARHPLGFSICYPVGWGATIYQRPSRGSDTIRIAPERSTGRQTILQTTRFDAKPKLGPTAADFTFQGKPAIREIAGTRYDWIWQVTFERDGKWFHVQITSPIALDPDRDPLIAFANSFRIEQPVSLPATPALFPATTTTTTTTSQPATGAP